MTILLITFQTQDDDRHSRIVAKIKERSAWARLTSTTWCVKVSGVSASSLRDDISSVMTAEDRLFIADISTSYWASYCIPQEVTDWLNK